MAYEAILVGVGDLYIANTGTAFPAVNAAPGAGWTFLGETDGGVHVNHTEKQDEHMVDGESGPVKVTRSEEHLTITANLAEATLENLAFVLATTAPTVDAGPPAIKTVGLYRGLTVVEKAFLFRGTSPYGAFNAQYQIPRGRLGGDITSDFVKDGKVLIPVEFKALVDSAAASDIYKFGRLVAQTA